MDELPGTQLILEVCPEFGMNDDTVAKRDRKLELAHAIDVRTLLLAFPNNSLDLLLGKETKYPFKRKIARPIPWSGSEDSKPVDTNYSASRTTSFTFPQGKEEFLQLFRRGIL